MKITDRVGELQRSEMTQAARLVSNNKPLEPIAPVTRSDKVLISDAGRAMAARLDEVGAGGAPAELSAERADQIRTRILEGAYNSLDMADEVARRILASGDL